MVTAVDRLLLTLQDKQGKTYEGLRSTFRRIYAEEGVAALMSGVTPRVREAVAAMAVVATKNN